jgi:hypothetical protein
MLNCVDLMIMGVLALGAFRGNDWAIWVVLSVTIATNATPIHPRKNAIPVGKFLQRRLHVI